MSSKILKASVKKIRLVPRFRYSRSLYVALIGVVLLIFVLVVFFFEYPSKEIVNFGSKKIIIERASTKAERQLGLSGRERLGEDAGLLFVFDYSGQYCFWMKDMNFSIDILWLDDKKKVVDMVSSVSPESYPDTFCPKVPASYVLEVNAGQAKQHGVAIGTQL